MSGKFVDNPNVFFPSCFRISTLLIGLQKGYQYCCIPEKFTFGDRRNA